MRSRGSVLILRGPNLLDATKSSVVLVVGGQDKRSIGEGKGSAIHGWWGGQPEVFVELWSCKKRSQKSPVQSGHVIDSTLFPKKLL